MNWFLYALLCALFLSTSDVFAKKALKNVDEYVVAWGRLIWAAPFILCTVPFTSVPPITSKFWIALLILLPFEITAIILYIKAIKASPLSITTPFLGLTPLFLIVTSFLILGELPDKSGFFGIFLVALGAYSLNLSKTKTGPLGPLRAVVKEKGSLLMVIVALIYSITSILGKIAAQNSSPVFFSIVYVIVVPFLLLPVVYFNTADGALKQAFSNPNFILLGFFYGLMILCHLNAIVLVEVPYMISVKRTSLLFSIIYGRLIFKEKGFYERLTGGLLILIGILFITIL
jgi:uncharacterized membrane protein